MSIEKLLIDLKTTIYDFTPTLVSGLLVLIFGLYFSGVISRQFQKSMSKHKLSKELSSFLSKLIKGIIQITVIISTLSILGVKTSSFLAILGSAGLAIGLALQGSLSNLAGGVLILIIKPFRLADLIEYSGHMGTVESIDIFTTKIKTADNKLIIIPNGPLANGVITNYSAKDTRRNEWIFSIGYNDDVDKAKSLIRTHLLGNDKVLKDPEPFIAVHQLADNSVNIVARAWSNSSDLWPVYFQTLEDLKITFDKEGISIPFPQREVHVYNNG